MTSLRSGFNGAEVDAAGAVALARAEGVPGGIAARLIAEAAAGIRQGQAERKKDSAA